MSLDPNRELNPIFADDHGDAFSSPEQDAGVSSDLGSPDMRGVLRRESPGVAPANATTPIVDDPGVNLPNAGRADRGADLESTTAQSVTPDERLEDAGSRDVDTSDGAFPAGDDR
jgi:hypothetical protein